MVTLSALFATTLCATAGADIRTSEPDGVSVGEHYTVIARAGLLKEPGTSGVYTVRIVDAASGTPLQTCVDSDCAATFYAGFGSPDNRTPSPQSFGYGVQVHKPQYVDSDPTVPALPSTVEQLVYPKRYSVDVRFEPAAGDYWEFELDTGGAELQLPGYRLALQRSDGIIIGWSNTSPFAGNFPQGGDDYAFRGIVTSSFAGYTVDPANIYGSSNWFVLDSESGAQDVGMTGVDLAAVAAAWPDIEALCLALQRVTVKAGSVNPGAYESCRQAGSSAKALVRYVLAMGATGSAALVAGYLDDWTDENPPPPPPPPFTCPPYCPPPVVAPGSGTGALGTGWPAAIDWRDIWERLRVTDLERLKVKLV